MARFGTEPLQDQRDAQVLALHMPETNPEAIARPIEQGNERVLGVAAGFLNDMIRVHQKNQYDEGLANLTTAVDSSEQRIKQDPSNYKTASLQHAADYQTALAGMEKAGYDTSVVEALNKAGQNLYAESSTKISAWGYQQAVHAGIANTGHVQQVLADHGALIDPTLPAYANVQSQIQARGNALVASKLTDQEDADGINKNALTYLDRQSVSVQMEKSPSIALKMLGASPDKSVWKNLTPAQWAQYRNEAVTRAKAQAEQSDVQYGITARNAITSITQSGHADPAQMTYLLTHGTPRQQAEVKDAVNTATATHGAVAEFQELPYSQQGSYLLKLKAEARSTSPDATLNVTKYNAVAAQYDANTQLVNKNPYQYILNDPSFQAQTRGLDASTPQGAQRIMAAVQSTAQREGISAPLLDPALKARLVATYKGATPDQARGLLQHYETLYGPFWPKVQPELFGKGGLPVSAMITDANTTQQVFEQLKGVDNVSVKDLSKLLTDNNIPVSTITPSISKYWSSVQPALGATAVSTEYADTYTKLVYSNVLHGQNPEQAAKSAYDTMFGDYNFTGKWMTPKNMPLTGSSLYGTNGSLQGMQEYGAKVIADTKLVNNSTTIKHELQVHGSWQFLPQENRYVLLDSNGYQVMDVNNIPVSFTISQAGTAMMPKPETQDVSGQPLSLVDVLGKQPRLKKRP